MSTKVINPNGSITITIPGNPPFVQTWYPPPGSLIPQSTVPVLRPKKPTGYWSGSTSGGRRRSRRYRKKLRKTCRKH
jgi:hypothetical protein